MQTTSLPKRYGWAEAVEAAKTLKWDKYVTPAGVAVPISKVGTEAAAIGGVRSLWIDVTPQLAAYWMRNNFVNRPMKEDVVRAYARDMLTGKWRKTHQGLAFNDKDHLIDGQHRLAAIIMSGVTVWCMVTFGLPSKEEGSELTTMDCVDRGATRSVSDQLTIQHGLKDGRLIAGISGQLASLCFGERARRLSVGQTLEVYREYEHAIAYVIEHRPKEKGLKQLGILAGFTFALATDERFWETSTPIADCLDAFVSGQGLEGKHPIALLRQFAVSEEAKLFTRSMSLGLAELTLRALFLWKAGAKVTKLEVGQEGVEHFRKLQEARIKKVAAIFKLPVKEEAKKTQTVKAPSAAPQEAKAANTVQKTSMPAPAAVPARPTLEKIIKMAERHFGIGRIILLNRRATEDSIVSARACLFRIAIEAGGMKVSDIAEAIKFSTGQVTGELGRLIEASKDENSRGARKYAAFHNRF